MTKSSPVEVLAQGAHALARGRDLPEILNGLLSGIAAATGSASGAILTADGATSDLGIVASVGLGAVECALLDLASASDIKFDHCVGRDHNLT